MVLHVTIAKKRPEEVFTPRGEFNPSMYTAREALEQDFAQKLRLSSHLVLFGESGCGKSWLYRSFFSANSVYFKIVNLADASRNGKIAPEILRAVLGAPPQLVGYDEKKTAQFGIPGAASGSLDQTKKYEVPAEDPLSQAIREFRGQAGQGQAFIVFDNLERIFDKPALMEELADIITLADDDDFLKHKVRFLIVGVPSRVKEYFNRTPSHRTIANRLVEIHEVSKMTSSEASQLMLRGFRDELEYAVPNDDEAAILDHVKWVTDKIPQSVHEYCLELAFLGESTRSIGRALLPEADRKWMLGSLNSAYAVIDGQLNERDTRLQRRNQVLYALGKMDVEEFRIAMVEAQVRVCFYSLDPFVTIGGIPNSLGELCDPARGAILRRTPRGDAFMFLDPQYRMCIRAMLRIGAGNAVEKVASDKL